MIHFWDSFPLPISFSGPSVAIQSRWCRMDVFKAWNDKLEDFGGHKHNLIIVLFQSAVNVNFG